MRNRMDIQIIESLIVISLTESGNEIILLQMFAVDIGQIAFQSASYSHETLLVVDTHKDQDPIVFFAAAKLRFVGRIRSDLHGIRAMKRVCRDNDHLRSRLGFQLAPQGIKLFLCAAAHDTRIIVDIIAHGQRFIFCVQRR